MARAKRPPRTSPKPAVRKRSRRPRATPEVHRPRVRAARPPTPTPQWVGIAAAPTPNPLPLRFIAWTYLMAGVAGLALIVVVGSLAAANRLEVARDPYLRRGLTVAIAAALPLNVLGLASGVYLFQRAEWARRTALLVAILGLGLGVAGATTATIGGVFDNTDLGGPGFLTFALLATLAMGAFYAWTIPTLARPETAALFRPDISRGRQA